MAVEDNLENWESVRNPVGEYFCASGYMWIVNWDHESGCCLMGPEENLDWQCEVAPRLGWRTGWWRRLETALEQTIGVQFSLESRWRRIACIGGLLLNMEGWVNWGCRERFTNLSLWEADLLWLLQCLPLTHKCFHSTFPVLHFLTKLTFIPSPQGNKSLLICLQNITYSHEPGRTWEQTCQTG